VKHITPDRLAADFGPRSKPAREGVLALNQALQADRCAEAETAVHLWQSHVSRALGRQSARFDAAMGRLARYYGLPLASDPARLLFALQTWYALIVERLLQRVLTHAGRRSAGEWPNHPLAWYRFAGTAAIEKTVGQVVERMRQYDPGGLYANPAHGTDLLKTLYQELFPRSLRHALGEYYTPDWLAEHVLDQLGYHGDAQRRVLDPACGSGTFLVRAIGRLRKACQGQARDVLYRRILQNVAGLDLHPLAVMTARANYLIAIADLLPEEAPAEVPVYWCDSILDERPGPDAGLGRFDFVMGNPPWVAWDNLPDAYRQATKPLWERYGLFSLSGSEARHGGGKKDLAMLMVYRSIDRYLQDGGRLGMVLTQTLFQSKGAGDGFRRFRLGADGPWLRVLQVDDFVAMRPFGDAANWTSTIVLEKGARTQYPVPYVKWSAATAGASPAQAPYWARPIEQDRPSSPWLVSLDRAAQPAGRIGPSDYTAHLGANSGGANSVYWLEILGKAEGGVQVRNLARCGKRDTEAVSTVIEPDLLYPLVRWGDVRPWSAVPSACLLLAQDVVSRTGLDQRHLERELPRTYAYLCRFRAMLSQRAAYRRYQGDSKPFYSMYNVGAYTLSPVKVVWRRMDRRLRAAVLEPIDAPHLGMRPVIPQETCVLIACATVEEAHYLCAMLNSTPVNRLVAAHNVSGGKGFGTPSILDFLGLRRFDPGDPRHLKLAVLSRQAHALARSGPRREAADDESLERLQLDVDRLVEAGGG
jgi:SAM-dependent methyltransferase